MKLPKARKLPSGKWNTYVRIGDKRVSVTADTKTECESRALTLKFEDANKLQARLAGDITLREAINSYIESRSNVLSPTTIRGYHSIRDSRFQSVIDIPIRDVASWQSLVNHEAKEVSAKTLKNSWGFIRSVLTDCGHDPGPVRLSPVSPAERPFLDPDQIKVFLDAIKGDKYELAYLLCLHGLRRSEMLAVTSEDVNGTIRINKTRVMGVDHKFITKNTAKTATSIREVPVFIPRLTELVRRSPEGPLVTTGSNYLNVHLKLLCRQAGLPEVTLHCLRHSFASLCYHLKISELQCMELGGWSDLATMRKIYTHIADADRKKAAEDLKAFFI